MAARRALVAAFLTCVCISSLHALRLEVSAGFGGTGAPGAWLPLWISSDQTVENAEIEIVRIDNYGIAAGVERYPFTGAVPLEVAVLPETGVAAVQVRLLLSGRLASERKIDFAGTLFPGHIVLAVGLSAAVRSAVENLVFPLEPVRSVETALGELPANALNYDAVSAVVIRDPGPVLSPAQLDALRAWIAAGGVAVLLEAREGKSGLRSALVDDTSIQTDPGRRSTRFGLGAIHSVPLDDPLSFGIGGGPALNELAGLAPYDKSERLRLGRLFSGSDTAKTVFLPPWMYALPVAFALWAIVLRWVLGGKRKALRRGVFLTLAVSAAALAGGFVVDGLWMRGSQTVLHAVILPERAGVALDFDTAVSTERLIPAWSEPWSLTVAFGGSESGTLLPLADAPGMWRHSSDLSLFALRSATRDRMRLGAVVPAASLAPSELDRLNSAPELESFLGRSGGALSAELYLGVAKDDAIDWRKRSGGSWIRVEQLADFFDRAWAERLLKADKGRTWLFGQSDVPSIGFEIQNAAVAGYQWAWLVPESGTGEKAGKS